MPDATLALLLPRMTCAATGDAHLTRFFEMLFIDAGGMRSWHTLDNHQSFFIDGDADLMTGFRAPDAGKAFCRRLDMGCMVTLKTQEKNAPDAPELGGGERDDAKTGESEAYYRIR